MPPFLEQFNACILFNDKTPLPGAKAILTRWVCTDLIFEILREYILTRVMSLFWHKTVLETMLLLEQLLRVIWETGLGCSPQFGSQIKPFPVPVMSCLLIIFLNSGRGKEGGTDLSVGPYLGAVPQRSARL